MRVLFLVMLTAACSAESRSESSPPAPAPAPLAPAPRPPPAPPSELDEVRAMLGGWAKPGVALKAAFAPLRPTPADYRAIFSEPLAGYAKDGYYPLWVEGDFALFGQWQGDGPVRPPPAGAQLTIEAVTTEQLRSRTPGARRAAAKLAPQWTQYAGRLKPGLTFYTFTFAHGDDYALTFDGLVRVNGRWVIVPRPWLVDN
jgi:hypothetical protein